MKIIVFSDLHAHPYKSGQALEEGRNSRVMDAVSVIDQVYSYATKEMCKDGIGHVAVLFGGDLFDKRKSIDVDTFNCVFNEFRRQNPSLLSNTVLLPGNHDQANKSGTIHALATFEALGVNVVHEPKWYQLGSDTFLFAVPYRDDPQFLIQAAQYGISCKPVGCKYAVLLLHFGINGAKVGASDYVLPSEVDLHDLRCMEWDIILGGHYHMAQYIEPNFYYIGSAMQHRWDDAGIEKSFMVIDTVKKSVTRVPTKAPTFLVVSGKTKDVDVSNSFVRVVRDQELEPDKKDTLTEKLLARGAHSVEYTVLPKQQENQEARVELSVDGGFSMVIKDYVVSDLVDTSGLDLDRLLSLGNDILLEVSN